MKKIRIEPNVPAEVRAIEQKAAMTILEAIHRYAETGACKVKPLYGEFEGLLRLRVGDYRVFFEEDETSITVHRVRLPIIEGSNNLLSEEERILPGTMPLPLRHGYDDNRP